jgi:malonyl CoA-acyl carrier protein transacylase
MPTFVVFRRAKASCPRLSRPGRRPAAGRALAETFPAARQVFEDDARRQRLSRLMFEGPESDLTLTENAQPALMATSLAVARVLEGEGGFILADKAAFVAGHSLGEYSALAACGALRLADTAAAQAARPGDAAGSQQ